MTTRILILGGTTEARILAGALAGREGVDVTVSLAGRTAVPAPQPVPVRVGGFGGAEGLARHIEAEGIELLVDATHPYAAAMSANAAEAASASGVAFLAVRRRPWHAQPGDRWTEVAGVSAAIAALGPAPRRAFLALGRNEVRAAEAAPQHFYLVRSVDPVEPPLAVPDAAYLVARGPFPEAGDRDLLEAHRIDAVVAKNSGGAAGYGKIAAARALGIQVILLARPALPVGPSVTRVEDALAWVDHRLGASASDRGV